jgi:hypothetical protein
VVVALVQVQRNIKASTAGRSPLSIETPFILSPLAASRLGTQYLSEPRTKVLGPRSIDYWGRGGGFNCIQTLKTERQGYICGSKRYRGQKSRDPFTRRVDLGHRSTTIATIFSSIHQVLE